MGSPTDELAAGTGAAVSLAEKLLMAPACERRILHNSRFQQDVDPFAEVAAFASEIPEYEWERQRRLGRRHLSRIDATHPPSQLRADLLSHRAGCAATVHLTVADAERIDQELATRAQQITHALRQRFPK
jgi:hypothetical protein